MYFLVSIISANVITLGELIPKNTPWVLTINISLNSSSSPVNYVKLVFPSGYNFSTVAPDGSFLGSSITVSPPNIEISGFTMNPGGEGGISIRDFSTNNQEKLDSFLLILANSTDTTRLRVKFMVIREDTTVPLLFFHKSLAERPFLLGKSVNVRGIVSAVIGSKTYIQDTIRDTLSGIVIYGGIGAYPGEYIKVSGTFSPYRGLEEIVNPVLKSREYVGVPSPYVIDRLTYARELRSGVLIRIDSVRIPDTLTYIPISTNITITDKYGNSGNLYIDRYTYIDGFFPPDTIFDLIGVVDEDSSSSGNIYRIIPRTTSDLIFYSSVYVDRLIPLFGKRNTPQDWKLLLYSINTTAKLRVCSDGLSASEVAGMKLGNETPDSVFSLADTVCAQFWGISLTFDTLKFSTEPKNTDSVMLYIFSAPDTLRNFKRSIYTPRLYFTIPISEIQARNPGEYSSRLEGQTVLTAGVVMAEPSKFSTSNTSTYIYDGTGGVNIYSSSFLGLKRGNVVLVKGTVTEYRGLTEVVFSDLRIIGEDTLPQPLKLLPGQPLNEDLEGFLVRVDTVVVSSLPSYAGIGKSFTVQNGSAPITVYVYPNTGIDLSRIEPGKFISIVGIVGQYSTTPPYNTGYQLIPRDTPDIIFLGENLYSQNLGVVIKKNVFIPSKGEVALIEVNGPQGIYEVKIYDDMGRLVKTLAEGNYSGGFFTWDGKNISGRVMPPGVYVLYVGIRTGERTLKKVKPIVIGVK
ncbi:MAG: FlgD immunoglobulin-like domain containing protein [candidate division WOR-3 bacterium]